RDELDVDVRAGHVVAVQDVTARGEEGDLGADGQLDQRRRERERLSDHAHPVLARSGLHHAWRLEHLEAPQVGGRAALDTLTDVRALDRQRVDDEHDEDDKQRAHDGHPAPLPARDRLVLGLVHGQALPMRIARTPKKRTRIVTAVTVVTMMAPRGCAPSGGSASPWLRSPATGPVGDGPSERWSEPAGTSRSRSTSGSPALAAAASGSGACSGSSAPPARRSSSGPLCAIASTVEQRGRKKVR